VRLSGGVHWPDGYTNVDPVAIVSNSHGLVALGVDRIPRAGLPPRTNGLLWRSKTGARWSEVATIKNALVTDIVTGPDGLLIAGEQVASDGRRSPAVWTSNDGKAWRRQRLDREGPPPMAVAESNGVRLVLGHKIRNDLSTWTRLWRSTDAGGWSRVDLPGGLSEDQKLRIRGPVATPSGFLLFTGERDRPSEMLWRSDNGQDWELVPLSEGWSLSRSWVVAQPWPWQSLVIGARRFPAYLRQASLLLTTDGGLTWCRSDSPGAAFTATDAAAGPNGSLLMVGGAAPDRNAWLVRWMHESVGTGEEEGFPCDPLPASEIIES
jgi:hypothetical protein